MSNKQFLKTSDFYFKQGCPRKKQYERQRIAKKLLLTISASLVLLLILTVLTGCASQNPSVITTLCPPKTQATPYLTPTLPEPGSFQKRLNEIFGMKQREPTK